MTKTATDYKGTDAGSASAANADGTIVVTNKDTTQTQYTYNKDVFTVTASKTSTKGKTLAPADYDKAIAALAAYDAGDAAKKKPEKMLWLH